MKQVHNEVAWLGVILFLALSLRLWGINFGLPYLYHPDEPRYVKSAQLLFQTHDLNPNSLPDIASSTFVYVVNALAYVPYYLVGKLTGAFQSPADIPGPQMLALGVGIMPLPSAFLLSRLVTTAFALGNIVLTFLVGRVLLTNSMIGLLAALMMAVSPSNVINSRYVTPDTFVVFFVLAAFLGAVYIYQRGGRLAYVLTGAALGCLASTKISGGLIVLPVLTAHLYRKGVKGIFDLNLLLLGTTGAVAFLVTTPYLFGDAADVVNDMLFEGRHYATGHPGMEGDSLAWYLRNMWQTVGLLSALPLLEILRGIYRRDKEVLLLSIFPVVYFIFISSFVTRNDRTFLPITPFLFLLAASFLLYIFGLAKEVQSRPARILSIAGVTLLTVFGFATPLFQTTVDAIRLTTTDSRETARVWIETALPKGAHIAIESYAPFINPTEFAVQGFFKLTDHEPEWYVKNGYDYLIFSQGMFGRFFQDPQRYGADIIEYNEFFRRFTLLKKFTDGGYEVRVYVTR